MEAVTKIERPAGAEATPPAAAVAPVSTPPQVVIVGAGFGGLEAARLLGGAPVRVTVVDRHNYHLFQPLLYQVATAALSPADIATPIRSVLRDCPNVEVLFDEVVGIDAGARRLALRTGAALRYDYLVLATGSAYSYFGHDDWAKRAPGLKTLDDATLIRRRLLLSFEEAESCTDEAERRRLLTFVMVGGGPTGVEMAGAVAELAKAALARDFRHIDPRAARILLIEAGDRLLAGFPQSLSDYTRKALTRMGVEVLLNSPVERLEEHGVGIPGRFIPASTIVWCAGVAATPVGDWLGVETARNKTIKVAPDLSVPGHGEIFVIGDAASVPGPDGKPLPGLAPVAQQQGRYIAELIRRRVAGEAPPGPFRYHDRGALATIGRSAAVADFGWLRLKGWIGWVVWGLAHIYFLIGFRNRMMVFVNWLWAWLTFGRGARLITGVRPEPPAGADGRG